MIPMWLNILYIYIMPINTVLKIYAISFIATMLMLCVWIFLNHHFTGSVWYGMKLSQSVLKVEYCELNNTAAFFHQSMNTYSNLGYFFLGMIVILISIYDRKNIDRNKNLLRQFPSLSFFFGCCLVYLCFGSAFFHASLTWIGQRADMNGTYSVCIGLTGIGVYRAFIKKTSASFKKIYVAILLLIVIVFIEVHLWISSFFLLPFLIVLLIAITLFNYYKTPGSISNAVYPIKFTVDHLCLYFACCRCRKNSLRSDFIFPGTRVVAFIYRHERVLPVLVLLE